MPIKWEREKGAYFEKWESWRLSGNRVCGKWRFALYENQELRGVWDTAKEAKEWLANYQTARESPVHSITS